MVSQIRPVAASMFLTWEGETLHNGGTIACARLPASTCDQDWFVNAPNNLVGQLQDSKNLANVAENVYDGALKDGCYLMWAPESLEDRIFHTPLKTNDHQYPCLAIAGQFSSDGTSPNPVLRLRTTIVWEITTTTKFLDTEVCIGSTSEAETALAFVAANNLICANAEHRQFLKRIFNNMKNIIVKARDFYSNNKAAIDTGLNFAMLAGKTLAPAAISLL